MQPHRHIPPPPDPVQVSTVIQRTLKYGSITKIALYLKLKRQSFTKRFFKGERPIFGEAALALHAASVKDPERFPAVAAYWTSLMQGWMTEPKEQTQELLVSFMDDLALFMKLRAKPGTRPEQVVVASRLQATAAKLAVRVAEPPKLNQTPLKMARTSKEKSAVERSYAALKKTARTLKPAA